MSLRFKLLLSLLALMCFFSAFSQTTAIDSLKKVAFENSVDTIRFKAYDDLCYEYLVVDQDSSLSYGQRAVALAEKIKFTKGLAQAKSDLGLAYFYKSDLQHAIELWTSASDIREKLNDQSGMAALKIKLGAAYFKLGNFEKSLAAQMKALEVFERLNQESGIAQAANNVAAVFEHQKEYAKAREYYLKSLRLHEKNKDDTQIGSTLINIGNIHYRQSHYDSAIWYWRKALAVIPTNKAPQYESMAYNNLAETYTIRRKYDSAFQSISKAIRLRTAMKDYQGLTSSLSNLGRIYFLQGKFKLSEQTFQVALDSAEAKKLLLEESKIHLNLYDLYDSIGDFKKALSHYVHYSVIEDSLSNERSRKNLDELLVTYETEKKEQQINLQQLTLAEQQAHINFNYAIITGLIIAVGLVIAILFLVRSRLKRDRELSVREAFINATISSQESERKRFAQDLHDGMGQLISSLRLSISSLSKQGNIDQRIETVSKSEKIMNDMHHEIRSIAFNLMPQTLIQYGLAPALKEMAVRINDTGKITVSVSSFDMPERLIEVQEISIYRIAQEWINNTMKYSGATKIEVQLVGHEQETSMTIEDNGKGFDIISLEQGAGNGWRNIQSRLNLIKGTLNIDSNPNRSGTTLSLQIPLDAEFLAAKPVDSKTS